MDTYQLVFLNIKRIIGKYHERLLSGGGVSLTTAAGFYGIDNLSPCLNRCRTHHSTALKLHFIVLSHILYIVANIVSFARFEQRKCFQ